LNILQLEHVEKARQTNETKLQEIKTQIDEKLKSADEKRDEMLSALQEKLRLHVISSVNFNLRYYSTSLWFQEEHIKSVKTSAEDKTKQLEEQIRSRLQSAAEKREIIEKELHDKLKEQVPLF